MRVDDHLAEVLDELPKQFERWSAQLATGLQSFEGALALQGARNIPVGVGGRTLAQAGQGRLVGWSLRATGGAVTVAIRDSRESDNGDVVALVELAAETSKEIWLGSGVSFVNGLYVKVTGPGQFQGSLWIGAVG